MALSLFGRIKDLILFWRMKNFHLKMRKNTRRMVQIISIISIDLEKMAQKLQEKPSKLDHLFKCPT